jgi:citrate lyase subunit beta / citryl-CoA lyase
LQWRCGVRRITVPHELTDAMTPRSYLFVPADRPERFAKALASGADAVIVDLEDAVAPHNKTAARAALAQWLAGAAAGPHTAVPLLVRINAPGTEWFAGDLALCGSSNAVSGVMLPKAERGADVEAVHRAAPGRSLIPLIETAEGFDHLRALAGAAGVQRLAFGSIDFQLDLGMAGGRDDDDTALPLLFFRSQLVLASRLASLLPPIDGVTTSIDDAAPVARDAQAARRLGFGAKLCIHPRQVAAVNAGFTPSAAEVDWARRVVAAVERSEGAAVAVDGKMVDRPVLMRARVVLGGGGGV